MRELNYKKIGFIACIVISFVLIVVIPVSAAGNDTPIYMSGQNIDAINAYNNGSDLASQGKFQDALAETEKALSIQPNFTLALTQKAGILNIMGNYQDGLNAANAAIAQNQNIAEAWLNRADALVHLGNYQDAIDSANRALATDPTLEAAKTTKLLATKLLGNRATPTPVPTTKAPASIVPVIGALAVAGCAAGYRKFRN